ncbi:MAG TPA: cytochrome C oxidase subunit IV family protein [Phycisphaerae bacterium]|jgi:cytochrome c oxidase subunit 4
MAAALVPRKTYVSVFVSLMVLLALTVGVDLFDLGAWNTVISLAIAVAKAILVVLFFMHVRYSERLIWIAAVAGFFWLAILLALTMSDYGTRGSLPARTGWTLSATEVSPTSGG